MEITSGISNDNKYSYIVDLNDFIHFDDECIRLSGNPGDANTVTYHIGWGIRLSKNKTRERF